MQRLQPQARNYGEVDVAPDGKASHILIFRHLEPTVTEEMLAKGAAKLLKSDDAQHAASAKVVSTSVVANAGANKDTILRVLLVRDRRSNDSWRFGFVEFVTVEDAQAAMAKFNSLDRFTISSKPVEVDYIHAGVFVPVLGAVSGQEQFTIAASNDISLRLAYRDFEAYVNELRIVEPKADDNTTSARADPSKVSKDEETKPKKRKAEAPADKAAKKVLQLPPSLQTWTNRQAELRGEAPTSNSEAHEGSESSSPAAASNDALATVSQQSYADPDKLCCWLCRTKFPSVAEIHKHERLSKLHQKNLGDDAAIEKATAKLVERGIPLAAEHARANEAYRDRAKERRDTFKQPKQPGFKGPGAPGSKASQASSASTHGAERSSSSPPSSGPPAQSKGAALLGKMGWSAGQGLGAQGTGSTAPIATDLYAAGVGLGAEGGRVGDAIEEAGRITRGDAGEMRFKLKDKARERFERLG